MSLYRCSRCGQKYTHDAYMELESVLRDPEQPKYGKESVCECGAKFHSDKWQLLDTVKANDTEVDVSTVALLIPHGMNHNHWFETCLFPDKGGSRVVERYETKEQAEEGHETIKRKLRQGKFSFEPTGTTIVMD